jgi:hypothetical protein
MDARHLFLEQSRVEVDVSLHPSASNQFPQIGDFDGHVVLLVQTKLATRMARTASGAT